MKLVAFDGDDTLWVPLSGLFLSDRTPTDSEGSFFSFRPLPDSPGIILRDDGARFALRDDAVEAVTTIRMAGGLTGVASFNHLSNVRSALNAFGIQDLFDYVVAEWRADKGAMLEKMVDQARRDGHDVDFGDVWLIDDDYYGVYAAQCESLGARFVQFCPDKTLVDVARLVCSGEA